MAQAMRWDDVGAFGDSRVTLRRQGFRGSFPTSPAQMELPGGILEEPNGRVPASAPLFSPPLARIAAVAIGVRVLSVGNKHGSGPCVAQHKHADRNITSLVSRFSRHFLSGDGSHALLLSTIPTSIRTDQRTGRVPSIEAASSQKRGRAGEAMPIRRLGRCGSRAWGHHPMGHPKDRSSVRPPSIRIRSAPPEMQMPLSTPRVGGTARGDCRPDGRPVVTGLMEWKSIVAQLAGIPKLHACFGDQ